MATANPKRQRVINWRVNPVQAVSTLANLSLGLLLYLICPDPVRPHPSPLPRPAHTTHCPHQFQPLIQQLLQALPPYANRALIRTGHPQDSVILASPPDFTPLPPAAAENLGIIVPADYHQLQQVFFTTLNRRHGRHQPQHYQAYHWLFFKKQPLPPPVAAPLPHTWHLSMMYTIQGTYPQGAAPLPPAQNSENGPLAQAIQQWLRDCPAASPP